MQHKVIQACNLAQTRQRESHLVYLHPDAAAQFLGSLHVGDVEVPGAEDQRREGEVHVALDDGRVAFTRQPLSDPARGKRRLIGKRVIDRRKVWVRRSGRPAKLECSSFASPLVRGMILVLHRLPNHTLRVAAVSAWITNWVRGVNRAKNPA
jgi:hypothetical protein